MTPEERIIALGNITVARGATPAEARTAKKLAKELRVKHGLMGKRLKKTALRQGGGGLPEPPRTRRKRIAAWWAELGAAATGVMLGGLVALRLITLLALLGLCIGLDLAGHHETRRYVNEWLGVVMFGGAIALVGLAAVFFWPLVFATWFLRTPVGWRLKGIAAFALENAPFLVMLVVPTAGGDWVSATYHVPELAAYFGLAALMMLPAALWWSWLSYEEWWQAWRYPA
jgi:hypothetical protein